MVPALQPPLTAVPAGFSPLSTAPTSFSSRVGSVGGKLDILSRPRSALNNHIPGYAIFFFPLDLLLLLVKQTAHLP